MYTINDLAMMTGLTTRTLRNYLKLGVLNGEKLDGSWRFTDEEIEAFFADAGVKQSMRANRHAVIYDFLADTSKKANRACVILDFAVTDEEGREISAFFCGKINRDGADITFSCGRDRGLSRVILSGSEDSVADILRAYYGER
ncbi:MAG: MerR family transcriptional regulator [Ruminococcaceae bacterium]|nr:MerR family transcriptional regulator [Oscillospiraceae bacterium]